ncbi:MAG: CHAT domain-containing tetratricopeptide repeat protein [Thermodesulfobacteriota bacterium]
MRRLLVILALTIVLSYSLVPALPAEDRPRLAGFLEAFQQALEGGDEAEAFRLARDRRDLVRPAADRLLETWIGQAEPDQALLDAALALARVAVEASGDEFLDKKIALFHRFSQEQRAAEAQAWRTLAEAEVLLGRGAYREALGTGDQAAEAFETLGDLDGQARALGLAGRAARELGLYQEAEARHKQALAVSLEAGDRPGAGRARVDLADLYERMKDHDRAVALYQEALAGLSAPEDWLVMVPALRGLGDMYVGGGRFEEAFQVYGLALKYAEQAGDPAEIAAQRDYIGYSHRMLGDYDQAAEMHRMALDAAAGLADEIPRQRARARALNHLGLSVAGQAGVQAGAGDLDAARLTLGRALEFEAQALVAATAAADERRRGYILRALAYLERQAGLLSQGEAGRRANARSLAYAEEALAAARASGSREWIGLALNHQALALAALGRRDEAGMVFDQAVALWEEIGDLKALAAARQFRAEALDEPAGWLAEALAEYARSLELYAGLGALEQTAEVHLKMGRVYERTGELLKARDEYLASIRDLESIRDRLALEEHKVVFFERRQEPYEALIKLLMKLYGATGDPAHTALAFEVSERARGRTILDIIKQAGDRVRAGVPEEVLARERELGSRLYRTRQALSTSRKEGAAWELRQALERQTFEYTAFFEKLRELHPAYAALKNPQPLDLDDIQTRVLGLGRGLLEYFVGRDESYLFIVRPDLPLEALILPVGKRDLARRVGLLRRPFELIKSTGNPDVLALFDQGRARELYEAIFRPAEPFIAGLNEVVIVPHGPLWYLPFEMLVTRESEAAGADPFARAAGARYLLESAPPLAYAVSASTLDPDLEVGPGPAGDLLLAFGNPTGAGPGGGYTIRRGERDLSLPPLPFSEDEVNGVARLFAPRAKTYVGGQAEKERFLEEAPAAAFILLSTHGLLDEKEPMFSALVFAPRPGESRGELLETYEVFNLGLQADLATLSACEVGLGELREGEGLIGMSRAFLYAGAGSVVVSLWSVDDQATAGLITEFHRRVRLNPEKRAAALKASRLHLLEKARTRGLSEVIYGNPFFWAPFVMIHGAGAAR